MAGNHRPLIKEAQMPARTTREQARERLLKTMTDALDRIIPADPAKPLTGTTFGSWEDQAEAFKRAVVPTLLEERAALAENAAAAEAGVCPHCASASTRLRPEVTRPEVRCPDGPAVVEKQHGRCRTCGGTFSPSGS